MSNWTKEETLLLIELWEQLPCLYDTQNYLYSNKRTRNDALFKIENDMSNKFTKEEIKSKLLTLRSNYNHEMKKIQNSKKSGIGADDIYSPTVFWFEHLKFLDPHVKSRPGKSNISLISKDYFRSKETPSCTMSFLRGTSDSLNVSFMEKLIEEDSPVCFPKSKTKQVNETDPLLVQASKMMESLNQNIIERNNTIPNENQTFGKLVTAKFNKISQLDNDTSTEAQQQIMDVLFTMERRASAINNAK